MNEDLLQEKCSNYFPLLQAARELLSSDPGAEQAVAARTAGGRQVSFANHEIRNGSGRDEDAFIEALAGSGDAILEIAVCLWRESTLDIPSRHLRQGLLRLDPVNASAGFLLQGAADFCTRTIAAMQ